MAEKTAKAAGGNWATAGTWEPEGVPTASDDVVLKSTSGNVTIAAAAVCRSLNCTGYTGTLKHEAFTLTIGTTTAPPESKALIFSAGMTYSVVATSTIAFTHSVASMLTIELGGKAMQQCESTTSLANTGGIKFLSAVTINGTLSWRKGILETNNQALTVGVFNSSNANVREFKFGSSTITVTAGVAGAFTCETTTNLTVAANTATVVLSGSGAQFLGVKAWNGLTIKFTGGGTKTISMAAGSAAALIVEGNAEKTGILQIAGNASLNTTTFGKITIKGNSLTNRVLFQATSNGMTGQKAAVKYTESISLENVDFMDIKGEGGAWAGTSIGDALGNEGITFTEAVTRFAKAAGNWSSTAVWSATSGGAAGASVPLCHDKVVMDSNAGAGSYTMDMPRACRDLICEAGFTRTLTQSISVSMYGNKQLVAGMTVTEGFTLVYAGRGEQTITSNGKKQGVAIIRAPGGTYSLVDDFNLASNLSIEAGAFQTNGHVVSCASLISNTTNNRELKLGNSTITCSVAGTALNCNPPTNLTVAENTATLVSTGAGASVNLGGIDYKGLSLEATGTGTFVVNQAGTLRNFVRSNAVAVSLQLQSATTIIVTGELKLSGTAGNLVTVTASAEGSAAIIQKTSGIVSLDYVSLKDSKAEGGARFYAGAHSTNVSGNSGWSFTTLAVVGIGQALETETAQAFTIRRIRSVGQATETETAQPFGKLKRRGIGQALETSTALVIRGLRRLGFGQALETDAALPIELPYKLPKNRPPTGGTVLNGGVSSGTATQPLLAGTPARGGVVKAGVAKDAVVGGRVVSAGKTGGTLVSAGVTGGSVETDDTGGTDR